MNPLSAELSTSLLVDKIAPLLPLGSITEEQTAGRRMPVQTELAQTTPSSTQADARSNAVAQGNQLTPRSTLGSASDTPSRIQLTSALANSAFEATRFTTGQIYPAVVLRQLDHQLSLVQLNGLSIPLQLGQPVEAGQPLELKYMGTIPSPTFLLTSTIHTPNVDVAHISANAKLIQHYLQPQQPHTGSTHIESGQPITTHPTNSTPQIAQDLQRAIAQTGLFYESHLAANIAGKYSLSALQNEPQNLGTNAAQHMVTQQLNLLEHPKLSWHGEVWPQQNMLWELEYKKMPMVYPNATGLSIHKESASSSPFEEQELVQSKLSLELPNLGHISAELQLFQGKLSVRLLADTESVTHTFRTHQSQLVSSMEASGLHVDRLLVGHPHVTEA